MCVRELLSLSNQRTNQAEICNVVSEYPGEH